MKNKSIVILLTFIVILILIIVILNSRKASELKMGKYIYSLPDSIDYSWIELNENYTFLYSRGQTYSYRPLGEYEIQDDKLILVTPDGNVVFKISRDKYITLEIVEDPLLNTNQKKLFRYEELQ